MKVVSVINSKGGVGKTTLSANLAAGIAAREKTVLIMDADPRMSLPMLRVGIKKAPVNPALELLQYFFTV